MEFPEDDNKRTETCRSDYNINIVKIKYIYCALLVEIKTITKVLQIFTVPTNAQFYYNAVHSCASARFGLNAIIRELTPILLKLTAIKEYYTAYAHHMYKLQ